MKHGDYNIVVSRVYPIIHESGEEIHAMLEGDEMIVSKTLWNIIGKIISRELREYRSNEE